MKVRRWLGGVAFALGLVALVYGASLVLADQRAAWTEVQATVLARRPVTVTIRVGRDDQDVERTEVELRWDAGEQPRRWKTTVLPQEAIRFAPGKTVPLFVDAAGGSEPSLTAPDPLRALFVPVAGVVFLLFGAALFATTLARRSRAG